MARSKHAYRRQSGNWFCLTISSLIVACFAAPAMAAALPTLPLTEDAVNDAALAGILARRAHGPSVLHAQVLLDRAHFSPGEMDAMFGLNMRTAVVAFQTSRALAPNGTIDAVTWTALNLDTAPALANYEITAADVAGPYISIPKDMMDKAQLTTLGYTSFPEALGERFHINPEVLQQLNPGKDLGRVGEALLVPNVGTPSDLPKAAKVVVDKSDSTVSLIDEAGKKIAQFPSSSGSKHDPLPLGKWKIKGVSRNPTFAYNPDLFWDADSKQAKAKIPAGPNNPVGVVWVDLTKPHYGIHGTPEPKNIGKTESHGCIRLTNWDATTLADAVRPGMPAILQK